METFKPKGNTPQYQYVLENFKGIDLANNPLTVNPARSPDMLNILPDGSGFPVSRTGYELKYQLTKNDLIPYLEEDEEITQEYYKVNGIYSFKTELGKKVLIHIGCFLFDLDLMTSDTPFNVCLNQNIKRLSFNKSQGAFLNDKLYIFDGATVFVYGIFNDNLELKIATDTGYIPITVISRNPDGGGTSYEAVNMVQKYKINQFLGTADATVYQLEDDDVDTTKPVYVWVMDTNGIFVALTQDTDYTVSSNGEVTFVTAPGESLVTGRDNIKIQYAVTDTDYEERINKCNIVKPYGINGNPDRLFVTGNTDFPNVDWFSDTNNEIYFPDINYSYVGNSNNAITGYSYLGDGSLAIHKDENGNEPTIYYRSGTLINNQVAFPLKQGSATVGSITPFALSQLVNDSLMLTNNGVFALSPINNVTTERYALQRSFFINKRLTKEENLKNAVAIVYKDFYYLAVNNNIYVADSRQKSYVDKSQDYQYEWYFLSNIPVRCFFIYENTLYFGTNDGRLMYFKSETDYDAYTDNINGKQTPFMVYFKTPILNLGTFNFYKTLKNFYVVPSPFTHTQINVDYIIKSINKTVLTENANIFDFSNIDFADFSFDTDTSPRIYPTNYKEKKFVTIQFMIWANSGEPLGFYALSLTYTRGGKYKG